MPAVGRIVLEALVVGLMALVAGFVSIWVVDRLNRLSGDASNASSGYLLSPHMVMAVGLFLSGVVIHVTSEITGLNNYYATMYEQ